LRFAVQPIITGAGPTILAKAPPLNPEPNKQRIFNLPRVIVILIAAMAVIEALREYVLSPEQDDNLLALFAFVPGRFTNAFNPAAMADAISRMGPDTLDPGAVELLLGNGQPQWWTPLTYSVLHGGWTHLGLNSLWLIAFGSPVAWRFGAVRFILLCAAASIAGAATDYLFHPFDLNPVIGFSASVSGAMGAAVRFVFQPGAPLGSPGGFAIRDSAIAYQRPAMPLTEVLTDRRTLIFVLAWFGTNLVFGLAAVPLGFSQSPVAWEAHIGGFLLGLVLFPLFDRKFPPAEELLIEQAPLD